MSYLLTGATGFLGKEILKHLNTVSSVESLGRTGRNDIVIDLSDSVPQLKKAYTIVVHAAGKAHMVPRNSSDADDFFKVNFNGTLNLLKALENNNSLPKSFIYISSVAVYGCTQGVLFDENTPLNASDPYGRSKKMAEEAVLEWGNHRNVRIGILRLPLVAGPNPPGNLKRMLRAQCNGYYFQIGNGEAKRSMVSATDVANIIPHLAEKGGVYNLTDQYHPSFAELGVLFAKKLNLRTPHRMNPGIAKWMAKPCDILSKISGKYIPFGSYTLGKMTSTLTFSDKKAQMAIDWKPQKVLALFDSFKEIDFQ